MSRDSGSHVRAFAPYLAIVVATGIGLGVAWSTPAQLSADAHNDWISTSAAWDGDDPYRPLRDLGAERDVYTWNPVANPRPPGAHVLSWPLTLTDHEGARHAINTLAVLSAVFIGYTYYGPNGSIAAIGILLFTRSGFGWGNLGPVVGALIVISMRYRSGIALGLAMALRLWPAPLVGSWMLRRDRRALSALVSFVVVTIAGLLLPGVTWSGFVGGMTEVSRLFDGAPNNGSLTSAFVKLGVAPEFAVASSGSLLGAWWWRLRRDDAALLMGLLLTPIAWASYYWAVADQMRGIFGIAAIGMLLVPNGWFTLGAGLLLMVRLEFVKRGQDQTAKSVTSAAGTA